MTMDKWVHDHIAQMMAGGNSAFLQYVREADCTLLDEKFLKYNSHKIVYYRYNYSFIIFLQQCRAVSVNVIIISARGISEKFYLRESKTESLFRFAARSAFRLKAQRPP